MIAVRFTPIWALAFWVGGVLTVLWVQERLGERRARRRSRR